ncbi:MAG: hypothetical protein H8M99_07550 [Gloeobacteraceae cyanobacterium ES-bin-144]|nr:hypothetical protein [Verrucomicrobiales bacterium]
MITARQLEKINLSAKHRHLLAGVAIALLVVSCSTGYMAPPVSPQLLQGSRESSAILQRGYVVHQAKCAKCHPFENPANYEISDLTENIVPEMASESKLNHADEQAVLAYLLAARKIPAQQQ